jgi:hypothetical protein
VVRVEDEDEGGDGWMWRVRWCRWSGFGCARLMAAAWRTGEGVNDNRQRITQSCFDCEFYGLSLIKKLTEGFDGGQDGT